MDETPPPSLSIEQEFNVRAYSWHLRGASREQIIDITIALYRSMLLRDNYYKQLIAHQWGMDNADVLAAE